MVSEVDRAFGVDVGPARPAVWVKPPGAADGQDPGTTWYAPYFPQGAPRDGRFWLEWVKDALAHTNMANLG